MYRALKAFCGSAFQSEKEKKVTIARPFRERDRKESNMKQVVKRPLIANVTL